MILAKRAQNVVMLICGSLLIALAACQPSPVGQQTPIVQTRPTLTLRSTLVVARMTSTPLPADTATFEVSVTAVATSTSIPSPTSTPRPTLTPQPTLTRGPTRTPSPTPTLEPLPPLTIRYPSLEQLTEYIFAIPAKYFNSSYSLRPPDYEVDLLHLRGFSEVVTLDYTDLNGDGLEDLIMHDDAFLAVFLWQGQVYSQPFLLLGASGWDSFATRFILEDWTNDEIPEIVWLSQFGGRYGTGVSGEWWGHDVINCQQEMCRIIWSQRTASLANNFNGGGIRLFQGDIVKSLDEQGQVILSYSEEQLDFYADETIYFEPLVIYPTTVTRYIWTGTEFEELSVETFGELQLISQDSSLEATNGEGIRSSIEAHDNWAAEAGNDVCQLFVDNQLIGQPFGCKELFTKVVWQDITNDGQPEIIVIALSGGEPRDEEYNVLSEVDCVHQRLLAYQWQDGTATEIANVAGCIAQNDLYGVRLEDIDGDEQMEIVFVSQLTTEPECHGTGYPQHCWFEFDPLDYVYKWNGTEFVFWGELPQE